MNIVLGLIMAAVGFLLVWKTEWLVQNFGHIDWAEQHLGSDGGTRLFWKLIGILIILIGFGTLTGIFQDILVISLSPLFRGLQS
jgi:hypothetical protein